MASNDNISIRSRIRKSSTSINPEFGPSTDSLLTFLSSSSFFPNKRSNSDSSIVITPLSTPDTTNAAAAAWRSASPLRSTSAPRGLSSSQRNRSFNRGHPPLLVRASGAGHGSSGCLTDLDGKKAGNNATSAEGVCGGLELDLSNDSKLQDEGMVDISLQDEQPITTMELETDETRDDNTKEHLTCSIPPPPTQQQQRQRCSTSPLPVVRSGSGLSMPAITQQSSLQDHHYQQQQQQLRPHGNSTTSSNNSLGSSNNSRGMVRSRSINDRSRSINKNMRARSRNRAGSSGGGGGGDSLASSGRQGSSRRGGGRPLSRNGALSLSGRRMRSAGAANVFNTTTVVCDDATDDALLLDGSRRYHPDVEELMITEPISVLLKDVISVRHETPYSSKHKSLSGATTATGVADLYSPHAITRVGSFTPPTSPPTPLYRPGSKLSTTSQSMSASAHCTMMNSYRIYIHTRMNGFLEFNFDHNSNSYEVVLAYLRCHLKEGMVPPDHPVGSGGGAAASSSSKSSLEQPVNLTRTRSLSNNKVKDKGGGDGDDATVTSSSTASMEQPPSQQPPLISRSNSSNPIERLQTKAINRQLQQEETPINSMKGWLSSIVDCAAFSCCQDTTVTPEDGFQGTPLRQSKSGQSNMTPRSRMLKSNGIGGLSFEVETVASNKSGF